MNENQFILECKKIDINITDQQLMNLKKYMKLLTEWNNKFNLTAIINEKDIYLKHFYDSLCLLKYEDLNNKKVCDIGTGAGFPGMVLAIVNEESIITLIESNNKKVKFLEIVKEELNLKNVNIICSRVEDYGKKNRELYDIVTCRAVSNLRIIMELSISLLKINGLFLPMKSNVENELTESMEKCKKLGYKLLEKYDYLLPFENSRRTILKYIKIKKTDEKYPRNYNLIKNN